MSSTSFRRAVAACIGAVLVSTMIACGGGGGGGESQSGPPPMQFGIPANVTASDGTKCQRIEITWDAMTGARNFEIYRSVSPSGEFAYIDSLANVNPFAKPVYTDNSVISGISYYYKVIATKMDPSTGSIVKSEMSASDEGIAGINPDNPDNLKASDGTYDNKIQIEWSRYSGTNYCKVYRATSAGGPYNEIASNITVCSYADTTTDANTHYFYKVKAFNDEGESDYSNIDEGWRTEGGSGGNYRVSKTESFDGSDNLISYTVNTYDKTIHDRVIQIDNYDKDAKKTGYSLQEYDESGRISIIEGYDSSNTLQSTAEFTYNENGKLEKSSFKDAGGNLLAYSLSSYDANGNNIKTTSYNSSGEETGHTDFTYSSSILQSDKNYSKIMGTDTLILQQEYAYKDNKVDLVTQKDKDNATTGYIQYEYNSNGLYRILFQDKNKATTMYIKYTYESY